MMIIHAGYRPTSFADLDPVADEYVLAVHARDSSVDPQYQFAPEAGELVQVQGRAVEEIQESVIAGR